VAAQVKKDRNRAIEQFKKDHERADLTTRGMVYDVNDSTGAGALGWQVIKLPG
jgi:hypothetical protein